MKKKKTILIWFGPVFLGLKATCKTKLKVRDLRNKLKLFGFLFFFG